MIVIPLLVAAGLGFAVRPARRAQLAVGALILLLALTLWFTVAHDDGETVRFVAALAGLWVIAAALAAAGGYLAARRGR